MEDATQRHFFHHGDGEPQTKDLQKEKAGCHWCQLRALPTAKTYPVTVVNNVDKAVLPRDFRFLDSCVLRPGVQAAEASFRSGCDCADDEECQYGGCLCLQEQEEAQAQAHHHHHQHRHGSDDEQQTQRRHAGPWARRKVYRYHMHGSKAGLLQSKFLESRQPIYECHDGCACSPDLCPNRVVERGRKVPLQIFRTTMRGWGVRALADIRRGQFVDAYVGEIITPEEARRRRDASTMAQRKDVYLFALDKFTDPDSPDPRLRGPPLEVDGEFMSGPTRFINHSCDPNLRIFARVGDHADKHIHDIAMFAIRDIPRGEELTFDYVSGMVTEDDDLTSEEKQEHMTRCHCGSDNCRGWLW